MDSIGNVLQFKKVEQRQGKRPINLLWERAKTYGEYVGLSTPFVMKLFKLYGEQKVEGIKSYLKDKDVDDRGKYGLAVAMLKPEKDRKGRINLKCFNCGGMKRKVDGVFQFHKCI